MCFLVLVFYFEFLKGVYYGSDWHYSPSNRAEVPIVGKGLQLDPNGVESLRSVRRGKEDRVLWAPIRQYEPCNL